MHTRSTARRAALVAAALLLGGSSLVTAHHGTNISYDRSKQFTTQAVVTEFEYRNPHPELHVEFKDDKGAAAKWSLELLPNPAQLIRNGWSRAKANEALKPGTPVMITVAPSKAGGVVGLLLRVTTISGEELVTGGGGPGGRQADPDAGRQGGAGRGAN
jgi:hypothetical protein